MYKVGPKYYQIVYCIFGGLVPLVFFGTVDVLGGLVVGGNVDVDVDIRFIGSSRFFAIELFLSLWGSGTVIL